MRCWCGSKMLRGRATPLTRSWIHPSAISLRYMYSHEAMSRILDLKPDVVTRLSRNSSSVWSCPFSLLFSKIENLSQPSLEFARSAAIVCIIYIMVFFEYRRSSRSICAAVIHRGGRYWLKIVFLYAYHNFVRPLLSKLRFRTD